MYAVYYTISISLIHTALQNVVNAKDYRYFSIAPVQVIGKVVNAKELAILKRFASSFIIVQLSNLPWEVILLPKIKRVLVTRMNQSIAPLLHPSMPVLLTPRRSVHPSLDGEIRFLA